MALSTSSTPRSRDRLLDPDSFEHDESRIIDLEAYRQAVEIAQDKTGQQSKDSKYYASQEIFALPIGATDYKGGGKYFIVTKYRARNSFGGMVRGTARGSLNRDCSLHTMIDVQ